MTRKEKFEGILETYRGQIQKFPEACQRYFRMSLMNSCWLVGMTVIAMLWKMHLSFLVNFFSFYSMLITMFFGMQLSSMRSAAEYLRRNYQGFISEGDAAAVADAISVTPSSGKLSPVRMSSLCKAEWLIWFSILLLCDVAPLLAGAQAAMNAAILWRLSRQETSSVSLRSP